MQAEIITIGDEILIGQVIDTNSAFLAKKLNEEGILVNQITSISDKRDHIFEALNQARDRADLIIMTGGLGPTRDDITKRTLCEYFDDDFVTDEQVLNAVKRYFESKGKQLLDVNRDQALVLKKARVAVNKLGTAPGQWIQDNDKVFISLPGVPYEMKALMNDCFLPWIKEYFDTSFVYNKTVLTQGVGESRLMGIINKWEDSLSLDEIKLAYLPSPGKVRLRLSAVGEDGHFLKNKVDKKVRELEQLLGDIIFGYDEDTIEEVLGKMLVENKLSISTAESCTGGTIAQMLTSVPGSSRYFKGSVVAYDNKIKQELLGVKESTLTQYGAVSEQTVVEMALGVKQKLNTDIGVATSGIAGPDGGTEEKPVGTVWIAVAGKETEMSRKFLFGNDRARNISKTALEALNMVRKEILKQTI